MDEREKHAQPKLYKCVYPGSRFTVIADHILEQEGHQSSEHTMSEQWHDNEDTEYEWPHGVDIHIDHHENERYLYK